MRLSLVEAVLTEIKVSTHLTMVADTLNGEHATSIASVCVWDDEYYIARAVQVFI